MHIGAIHQPDFIPWVGFFQKVAQVKTLIILDHVTVPGKSWINRNFLRSNGQPLLVTVPVSKGRDTPISEIQISPEHRSGRKILRTLDHNYSKSPFFSEIFPALAPRLSSEELSLERYNMALLNTIFGLLDISVNIIHSTDLLASDPDLAEMKGNELLLTLAKSCGFQGYVSGNGCLDFILPRSWEQNGIAFRFQHPVSVSYSQAGGKTGFVPDLSILDPLMEIGPEQTRDLVLSEGVFE